MNMQVCSNLVYVNREPSMTQKKQTKHFLYFDYKRIEIEYDDFQFKNSQSVRNASFAYTLISQLRD